MHNAEKLAMALDHYPSRGQTATQEIYRSPYGRLFLKRTSERNLRDCQIDSKSGTLAEREAWCYALAKFLGILTPDLRFVDKHTTIQEWFDLPDAHHYASSQGRLIFNRHNVFDCSLFDWITAQVDRHDANYLYDFINQRIILIDSAHSLLAHGPSLPDYLRLFEVAATSELDEKTITSVSKKIRILTPRRLNKIVPLRGKQESKALEQRLEQALAISSLSQLLQLFRSHS